MSCTVRVPATTANLGPGFDSFGCALGIYNTYEFDRLPEGLEISGCAKKYQNARNLTVRAYEQTLREAGLPMTGLSLKIRSEIPVSRGLGSSAAMIVAGALAANAAAGNPFDLRKILEITTRIEGHPDNLAPALYGGLTASMTEAELPDTVRYSVADRLHGAVLLKAMELGDSSLISRALNDRLHQPYRIPLIPGYESVRQAAMKEGAIAFCISGAGPTLLALTDQADFAGRLRARLNGLPHRWTVLSPEIDREGARITGAL